MPLRNPIRKHNNKPQTRPSPNLPKSSMLSPQCGVNENKCKSMTRQTVQSDTKFCDQRMRWTSIRTVAISFVLALPGLWSNMQTCWRCGPLQRPAFPRGIKSSCGRPGACRSKQYELKQNAEFSFGVNPQGSLQKCFKDALTSQGKSFRSAVHATTSRVLSKKESWQEWNECQMPASNYMHSKR